MSVERWGVFRVELQGPACRQVSLGPHRRWPVWHLPPDLLRRSSGKSANRRISERTSESGGVALRRQRRANRDRTADS